MPIEKTNRVSLPYILIVTGDELLSGKRQDRHIPYLSKTLSALGLECSRCCVIGDNDWMLTTLVKEALTEVPLVLVTGGLGPTLDDITREALSEATGILLEENEGALQELILRFRAIGRSMTENNRRQAMVPVHGTYLSNPNGTAPGLIFDNEEKVVVALPGPPRELEPMVRERLIPFLSERFHLEKALQSVCLRFSCLGESNIDQVVREREDLFQDMHVSSLFQLSTVDLTLSIPKIFPQTEKRLSHCVNYIREKIGEYIYSQTDETLAEVVGNLLRERNETLAVAESCTGGMLGEQITAIAGSSDYFLGGIISYQNEIKEKLLNVDTDTLTNYGAVSEETVRQMSRGVCARLNSTWGLAVTGIAGPGGGSPDKPVGTVWIAAAHLEKKCFPVKLKLFGEREAIRQRSCIYALDQLRRLLRGLPVHPSMN